MYNTVKEKLVEIVKNALASYGKKINEVIEPFDFIAEFMMDNGVTLQELDGCEYCKEDNEGFRKMFGAFSITNPFHGKEWFIKTKHCKPRQIHFCPMCGRKLNTPQEGE